MVESPRGRVIRPHTMTMRVKQLAYRRWLSSMKPYCPTLPNRRMLQKRDFLLRENLPPSIKGHTQTYRYCCNMCTLDVIVCIVNVNSSVYHKHTHVADNAYLSTLCYVFSL